MAGSQPKSQNKSIANPGGLTCESQSQANVLTHRNILLQFRSKSDDFSIRKKLSKGLEIQRSMTYLKLFWTCKSALFLELRRKAGLDFTLHLSFSTGEKRRKREKNCKLILVHFQCLEKHVIGPNTFSFCSVFFFPNKWISRITWLSDALSTSIYLKTIIKCFKIRKQCFSLAHWVE